MSKSRARLLQAEIRDFSVFDGCGPQLVVGRRNTLRRSIRGVWADHIKKRLIQLVGVELNTGMGIACCCTLGSD